MIIHTMYVQECAVITTSMPGRPKIKARSTKGIVWTGPMMEEMTRNRLATSLENGPTEVPKLTDVDCERNGSR